jgi:hypothetical protein
MIATMRMTLSLVDIEPIIRPRPGADVIGQANLLRYSISVCE